MYCRKCGKEINDDAVVCVNCGCAVKEVSSNNNSQDYSTPKTSMGVLMGLLLGLIGLVIGICIYPENTVARSSFIKAWAITFGISAGVSVLIAIIYFAVIASMYGGMMM